MLEYIDELFHAQRLLQLLGSVKQIDLSSRGVRIAYEVHEMGDLEHHLPHLEIVLPIKLVSVHTSNMDWSKTLRLLLG